MRMANKIGIVTAAASGMGRAGAVRFAKEGASVGVVDVDKAGVEAVVAEIKAAGGKALPIVADLTKDEDSRRIVKETAKAFGGLDFVWNHVGHPGPASVEGIDMRDYDLAMTLNLRTVLIYRLEREEIPTETVHQITAILDEAAQKIERL